MIKFIPPFVKNISLSRLVVALALALTIWGYVIATQYPERTLAPFEVPLGEPEPPSASLEVVPVPGQPSTVVVTISGQTDRLTGISFSQVKPYLDLSKYKESGEHDVRVQLRPNLLPREINIDIKPEIITMRLEVRDTKLMPIEVVREGQVNPDYNLAGPPLASPMQVTIAGRQSLLERVAKAQVTVDLTGRVGRLNGVYPVRLLDSRGTLISENGLTLTPNSVNVSADIEYKFTLRTVPIRVVTKGQPADGFVAGSAKADPLLATLNSGDVDLLNQIQFVTTEPLDISGATKEVTGTVSLQFPLNVTVQGKNTVQVSVGIVPFQVSKTIAVPLEFINQAGNLRYTYDQQSVNLTLSGPFQAFQDFPLDKIRARVDVQGRVPGTYSLPVQLDVPGDVGLVVNDIPTVNVSISRPPTPTVPVLPTIRPPFLPPTVAPTLPPGPTATLPPAVTTAVIPTISSPAVPTVAPTPLPVATTAPSPPPTTPRATPAPVLPPPASAVPTPLAGVPSEPTLPTTVGSAPAIPPTTPPEAVRPEPTARRPVTPSSIGQPATPLPAPTLLNNQSWLERVPYSSFNQLRYWLSNFVR